ncbi:hypothetical protein H4219_005653 [Mycoemilia scoparia]|uniref:Uncharacterized protein n=1 Tax=Mycoemilia scoparia TaxID=417184 RepID=A0A9W8DJF4_9FUNG|nr:hypothetical protein H4219_005653 [Mycoemilia scoparia]
MKLFRKFKTQAQIQLPLYPVGILALGIISLCFLLKVANAQEASTKIVTLANVEVPNSEAIAPVPRSADLDDSNNEDSRRHRLIDDAAQVVKDIGEGAESIWNRFTSKVDNGWHHFTSRVDDIVAPESTSSPSHSVQTHDNDKAQSSHQFSSNNNEGLENDDDSGSSAKAPLIAGPLGILAVSSISVIALVLI